MGERHWWGEAPERPERLNIEFDLAKSSVCFADRRAEPCPSVSHSLDFAIRLITLRSQRSGSMADAGIGSDFAILITTELRKTGATSDKSARQSV